MKSKQYLILISLVVVVAIVWLVVDRTSTENTQSDDEAVSEEQQEEQREENTQVLQLTLEPKNESGATGVVTFKEKDGSVEFVAKLSNLSEGLHAIHIHEKADCSSPDGKSTGGHWNPTLVNHGKWGDANGYHRGDIGNFTVGADGTGEISMTTDEWCIGCVDESKNIIGKAIIVHQGEDDFTSQPSGNAGARVSCAAIIKIEE